MLQITSAQDPRAPTISGVWPPWLTRDLTAAYLWFVYGMQFGVAALAKAATKGTGPPFSKQGANLVSYWRADVDEWARTRMSRKVRCTRELRDREIALHHHMNRNGTGGDANPHE